MKLKIASAQYPISHFKNLSEWKNHITHWIQQAVHQGAEILVFPEYGAMELVSLFSPEIQANIQQQVQELQTLLVHFIAHFDTLAQQQKIIIIAPSFPVVVDSSVVNRVFVFASKGLAGYQDKFFMTRFENESWGIQSGKKKLRIFQTPDFSFGVQICYDIEFAIGSNQLCHHGADFIVVPSCTETIRGATRVHVGARARALENQCYTIVSQTVQEAIWSPAVDLNFGYAAVYSSPDEELPEEGILHKGIANKAEWVISELDFDKNKHIRQNGQVFNFKDHDTICMELKEDTLQIEVIQLF